MPTYDSGRVTQLGGIGIKGRRSSDLNGIRFDANRDTLPSSANDFILFRHAGSLKVWDGTSTVTISSPGVGGIPSWETLFAQDATFNVAGTTWTIDNSTGNNAVLTLTNTGAGSGAVLQITNAGTGADIRGDSGTWSVTKAGVATFVGVSISGTSNAFTSTGAATWTLLDNSATALSIGASGDTNIMVISTDNTTPEVIFNDNLRVVAGLATFISTSNTVQNVLITNNTITTFGVTQAASAGAVVIRSTSLTTGTLLRLQLSNTTHTTGFYLECLDSDGGGTSEFTIGENGTTVIAGAEGVTSFTMTTGDAVISLGSLSVTDNDNGVTFEVINNTATTGNVIALVSTTGVFTGVTTSSYMHVSHSALTTGTLLRLTAVGATTSVAVVDIATMGLTSGSAFRITADTGVFTTGGKLIELSSTAAVAGNLLTATTTGAYTGTGMVLITAGAMTTGITLSIVSTTGLTTGSLIRATSSTAGLIATNGAISFTASGDFTSTSGIAGGFVEVKANSTVAGTIVNVLGTALTTGVAVSISNATSAMTTGSLLRVGASGTGAIATNGIVSITHGGIYTSTSAVDGGLLDIRASATTAGVLVNVVAVGLITGVGLHVSNGTAATTSGSLLRITAGGTGAVATNGIVSLTHTGIYTSTTNVNGGFVEIKASATTAGVILNVVGVGLITGVGISVSNGTAAMTTGSLILAQAGGTGAVSGNGIVSFLHTGVYTSTTVGFVNVVASATTAGTAMTITSAAITGGTNLQLSTAAITTGKHFNVLGSAGASHFSIGVNGLTTIAGVAQGTDALVITAGDILLTSGNIDQTVGNHTISSGNFSVSGTSTLTGNVDASTATLKSKRNVLASSGNTTMTSAMSGSIMLLDGAGVDYTLPAIGAGDIGMEFWFVVTVTATDQTIVAASGDILTGGVLCMSTAAGVENDAFSADATDDLTTTMNGTTQGGIIGSTLHFIAISATRWYVDGTTIGSGTLISPFT